MRHTRALPLTLRRRDAAAACLGLVVAVLFLLSNAPGIGAGLLCACGVWLITRARAVAHAGAAGRHAQLRGVLAVAKTILILAIYGAVVYALFVVRADAPRLRVGVIASVALAGLAFLLSRESSTRP
jgi:hypothetical protein